jgi:DNA-binding Lrp family transcriptional regulator
LPGAIKDFDLRILRELTSPSSFQWDFRESYATMAERLGADSETVRVTLRRAIELGLVKEWRLILNPVLLGRKLAGMQLEVDGAERKARVISQVRLVEGVVQMLDFHGTGLRVVLYFEDEVGLERQMELIKSLAGHRGDAPFWISSLPACDLKLREVDWRIIGQVMHDPRRDAAAVARKLGVSSRTVNRRLRRMSDDKVAYLIPVRDVKKAKGVICSYLILCSEKGRKAAREFLTARPARVDFLYDSTKGIFIVTLVTDNLPEADSLCEQLRSLEGVEEVRMGLLNDFIFVDGWLDQAVARRVVE